MPTAKAGRKRRMLIFKTSEAAKSKAGKLALSTKGRARAIPSKKEKLRRKRVKYLYRVR